MKRLLPILLLCWSWSVWAQPILRNPFTTNSTSVTANRVASVDNAGVPHGNGFTSSVFWDSLLTPGLDSVGIRGSAVVFANSPILSSVTNLSLTASTLVAADSTKKLVSIANGVGMLTNDGSGGFGFTTNVAQDVTYNNVSVTNLTVLQTNIFNVSKGGHLTISNSLSILTIKTNLLATDANGLVTNANYGSGITWTPSTLTLSASGGSGGASTWIPNTTLAYSGGTNVTMDASGGTNFVLTVTNTTFLATPSNAPGSSTTTNTTWTIWFKMDSTGGYAVTWTNIFKFPGGVQLTPDTNANAISMFTISTHPFTNGLYAVDYGLQRIF